MRHPDLPETCDLTEITAPDGTRGFRVAFTNHPCPDAWLEGGFDTDNARLLKTRRHRGVPVTKAARLSQLQPKATPLMSHLRKSADPRERARQILAGLKQPAAARPASAPEDPAALARQHLARLATTSAARVGHQEADSARAGDGSGSLRSVIDRASQNVPGSGGVRWDS